MVAGMKKTKIAKALTAEGAYLARQGANHEVWNCACGKHQTAVPRHTSVSPGVVTNIIKQMPCHQRGWLQ